MGFGAVRKRASLPWVIVLLVNSCAVADGGPAPDLPRRVEAAKQIEATYRACRHIDRREYPIGVFDSGTGGLAALEAIVRLDAFDNQTREPLPAGDGKTDFAEESFVFLADQVNMPYGNYPSVGKVSFLEELIVKDAEFLLGDRYFADSETAATGSKPPVKAIVIACNTATAYGKDDIEALLAAARLEIPVVGVVDAGARGAVDLFKDGNGGTIGVLATRGTVLSEAYPRAIRAEIVRRGLKQRIDVVQQGSLGLAGAIDGVREFLVPGQETNRPRDTYQGPSLEHPFAGIDRGILARYAFDFSGGRMLFEGPSGCPAALQINGVENYLKYDLVTLLESLRTLPDAQPLRAIILGCTHFPYYAEAFQRELDRLRDYQEDGEYVYRRSLASKIELIDPAWYTARELHLSLAGSGKLDETRDDPLGQTRGEFYITVACRSREDVELTPEGQFTYEYKYGRSPDQVGADFRAVPLRQSELDPATAQRLRRQVPGVWRLMDEFNASNGK